MYFVRESDEQVQVCAFITGQIAREVRVTISTRDGTAIGGSDYILRTAEEQIFQAASQNEVCWNIFIDDDIHLEGSENFFLDLITNDPQIMLSPNTTQITIFENDSELHSPSA